MAALALFIFSILTHILVLLSAVSNTASCPDHFFCNEVVGNLTFPFKSSLSPPECGLYSVDCSDQLRLRIQLKEKGYWHELEGNLSTSTRIHIKNEELRERLNADFCNDEVFNDLSLPFPSPDLDVVLSTSNLTLYKCNQTQDDPTSYAQVNYGCRSKANYNYYTPSEHSLPGLPQPPPSCSIIYVPAHPNQPPNNLSALTTEFFLQVKCPECDGECLVDKGKFICQKGGKWSRWRSWKAVASAVAGFMVLVVIVCCLWKKSLYSKEQNQNRQAVEVYLKSYGPLQVGRYSYSEVKKMTNNFKEKLGQGGYGSVYKGKLNDGCLVAVKVLNKLKGSGEEFMNEVATISRTSHVNVVTLLGFCFEGSEKALVYEFMPNGSLEKFIYDANTTNKDHNHLGWEKLDQISLGIARGLEYLHRGCNTRILHFDIKPHNILLDENFTPKISDFGLAKICDRKESIVSMLGARGTAGYIAPEVFCRSFGGVSHKSDVYSYGMMLSEMVGGRRNINAEAENTSEIYFPHWIYRRIELGEELGLQTIMNDEDKARARKMIIVSLWCIQTDPRNRPAMKEVTDMLEGSVDSLQIPPKPYLSSPPPRSPVDSSTTVISLECIYVSE